MRGRTRRITRAGVALLFLACGAASCGSKDSKNGESSSAGALPSESPHEGVKRYFTALEKRDCEGLKRASAGTLKAAVEKQGCKKVFQEAAHHGTRLVKIESSSVAGRDPRARLVKIHMFSSKDRYITVRVQPKNGRWVLFNL